MRMNSKNQNTTNRAMQKKSKAFLMSTTAFVAGMLLLPSYAHAVDPLNSWDYDVVLDGNVGKDTSVAGITDITVTGGNGFVEGNADIYTGHTVNVTGDSGATFAYRDNRANIESTLNGNLNSNMKIVIIDKDGVFFGADSQIDVQGILATTGSVSVADIMDGGQLEITNIDQGGKITLNGTVTVAEAGLAAFVAPMVENNGIINAKLGRVQLGAAETVTVDLYGDGLLELVLDGQLADALLENNGDIIAEGGFVQMTALAAKGTVDNIVNNTGIITVASVTQVGGKIILSGGSAGTVSVSGTLDATGTSGGDVEVRGERITILDGADIAASGTAGNGGKVVLQADDIDVTTSAATFVNVAGAGGTVQIERLTKGRISLGEYSGGLHISQGDVEKIVADKLVVGNALSVDNSVTEINVRNFDTTASISGLVQLNSLNDIGGHKNEGDVEFDLGTNRFHALEVNAADDVNFRANVIVETLTGDLVFNADVDGDDATGDTNMIEFLGDGATINSAADIIFSGRDYVDVYAATSVNANSGAGSVTFLRSIDGTISLGDADGDAQVGLDMQIDQNEMDHIVAGTLVIGNVFATDNKVVEINVGNFDTTAAISGLVQLNSLSRIDGGGHKKEGDVEFDKGTSTFNALEVNAVDDVIFRTNVTVASLIGDLVFNADVDSDETTGDTNIIEFLGSGGGSILSAGDITFSGMDYVDVHDTTVVNANGGTGNVNFRRSSNGTIALGDASGDMQIDQGELDNISAGTLNVGNPVAVDSNTTDINVSNADISHINNVNLYALAASTVNYSGVNNFVNLNTNTSPTTGVINVLNGSVNATTSIHFNSPLVNLNGDLDAPSITGTATIVNVQSDAAQIQDGIDVATYYGATVNVAAGTFVEDVNVYKEVTLLGANAGNAGFGPRAPESFVTPTSLGFNITVDNVTLDGFKIKGGDTGVRVDTADNVSILNNIVTGSGKHAIEAYDADDLDIKHNKITYAGYDGIHVEGGAFANIVGNHIYHVGADGIDVDGQGFLNISYNKINQTGKNHWIKDAHGIEVSDSVFVNIGGNTIKNAGDDGINVEHSALVGIYGNKINDSGDDGIDINGSLFVDISYNKINGTGKSRRARDANGIEVSNSGLVNIGHNRIKHADDDGIDVEHSAFVGIHGNTIKHSGDDGVDVDSSFLVSVNGNTIVGARDNGVEIVNSFGTNVIGNGIYHVGENGVYAYHSAGTNVSWNNINDADANGIYLSGSDYSSANFNTISHVGEHGIKVNPSDFVDIIGNSISYAGWDGINVQGGIGADIIGNRIYHVGADGIDVDGSDYLNISYNKINKTGQSRRARDANGIEVSDSAFVMISRNRVENADDDGIDVEDSAFVGIYGNTIKFSGDDGIDVDSSDYVNIRRNRILDSEDNGIEIVDSYDVDVINNRIRRSDFDGVYVEGSSDVNIRRNDVRRSGGNGISSFDSYHVDIINNDIRRSSDDGVLIVSGDDVDVRRNDIRRSGGNGIAAYDVGSYAPAFAKSSEGDDYGYGLRIVNNDVSNSGQDGVHVENSAQVRILRNDINESGNDGIYVSGAEFYYPVYLRQDGPLSTRALSESGYSSVVISDNTVSNSGGDGIQTTNIDDLILTGNEVSYSYGNGVYVSGAYNGDVLFQGNTLTDNGHLSGSAGARFESGYIDMSDLENPNTFVNTTGLPAVAMQFDDISAGLVLSRETRSKELSEEYYDGTGLYIVNETLGSTVFDGYTPEESFYVRFEDGAILDDLTGEPIVIDGTNASFDGIIPALSGGILSTDDLAFIEERLYDADDEIVDGRGQIFVGAVPETPDQGVDNFEDFFFKPASGDGLAPTTARLEIRGLPRVSGVDTLNDIAPAVGEGANDEAQDLANINPEAGGDGDGSSSKEVTCMGDAMNSLADGSVTYSFGGSLEDSIAGASACATSAGT